ncbi:MULTISPECIES: phage virion morphogenesis protein [unclassified Aeromonas]|uniref:phage virion morphogenesis protein n=1 Tax=unclassified Aeromonas TaxID=257493 RepID=UPI00084AD83F|nr:MULTISPECIES: phage virion morphogenesis protein [unclassified Aeromonas]OEC48384.1 phage virion morphogenesis protein [Aeromonas sp. ANNP30]OEC64366.1 phage virion morphogenesis protein [Aeromonas sp. ANP5]
MAGSFIAISHHGVADAFDLLAKLYQKTGDLSEPLADIGEELLLSHRDRWDAQESPEGEPWAPLSEKYRARKPRHADEVLRLNDDLRDTLDYQVEPQALYFGTPMVYGAAHQFGRPEINLPERRALGLSEGDKQSVLETLEGYLSAE